MSNLAAKIVIVGIPLLLSLGWFTFWMIRVYRFGKRKRAASSADVARQRPDAGDP